jgi:cytidylate kinase
MGTVVFADADVKVFLTADLEERARRRLLESGSPEDPLEAVAREAVRIGERDRRDSTRHVAPLRRAPDALVLDTTHLAFEEQVRRIVERVEAWAAARDAEPPPPGPP